MWVFCCVPFVPARTTEFRDSGKIADDVLDNGTNSDSATDLIKNFAVDPGVTEASSAEAQSLKGHLSDQNSDSLGKPEKLTMTSKPIISTLDGELTSESKRTPLIEDSSLKPDYDLGLPPEIANEYIDNVNPPKVRVPASHPDNRMHAGSSVHPTKVNFSATTTKPNKSRNLDLATLLRAELDAKKMLLDTHKSETFTQAPNLFALLPSIKNPFEESNYKSPNRNAQTARPMTDVQLVFSDGTLPNERKPPKNVIELTKKVTNVSFALPSAKQTNNTKSFKIKHVLLGERRPTTRPSVHKSPTAAVKPTSTAQILSAKHNNSNSKNDWSSRHENYTSNRQNDTQALAKQTTDRPLEAGSSERPPIFASTFYPMQDYELYNGTYKSQEYNDFDYADNTAVNTNVTFPDGFPHFPGASYRLTTERLAYILIGSCCALSVLCLIVVAMSVRCRDMCDEYRSWKKAEKAAMRWHRHQYRMAHHQHDLMRYFRTSVDGQQDVTASPTNGHTRPSRSNAAFGNSCCHCINCSSSWIFRDPKQMGCSCPRGFYCPTAKGKLPFGAASSVNTFMPRYAAPNQAEEVDDSDSLNASDIVLDHPRHQCTCVEPGSPRPQLQQQRHQQLRRTAHANGNGNWLHSSDLIDELHKKHCNLANQERGMHQNGYLKQHSRHQNDNVVVWNNNDERLI